MSVNITGEGVLIKLTGDDAKKFIGKYVNDYGAQAYELTDIYEAGERKVKEFLSQSLILQMNALMIPISSIIMIRMPG